MTGPDIEALLREDEEALREKRKRLKAFVAALGEVRTANAKASEIVAELLDAGDLTRADLAKVLGLSQAERAALVPSSRRSGAGANGDRLDDVAHGEEASGNDVDDAEE